MKTSSAHIRGLKHLDLARNEKSEMAPLNGGDDNNGCNKKCTKNLEVCVAK